MPRKKKKQARLLQNAWGAFNAWKCGCCGGIKPAGSTVVTDTEDNHKYICEECAERIRKETGCELRINR